MKVLKNNGTNSGDMYPVSTLLPPKQYPPDWRISPQLSPGPGWRPWTLGRVLWRQMLILYVRFRLHINPSVVLWALSRQERVRCCVGELIIGIFRKINHGDTILITWSWRHKHDSQNCQISLSSPSSWLIGFKYWHQWQCVLGGPELILSAPVSCHGRGIACC